jgi:CRISPR/Cas system-associated protein Csm6
VTMNLPEDVREQFRELGRQGGLKTAYRMTPEQKRGQARMAHEARWTNLLARVDADFPGLTDAQRNEKAAYLYRLEMAEAGRKSWTVRRARRAAQTTP